MNKKIIYTAPNGNQVVEITDRFGSKTFKVQQGSKFIGKTKDGGYRTKAAAITKAAQS